MDASCTGDGYIQLHYSGTAVKAKLQLTLPDGNMYTYTLAPGNTEPCRKFWASCAAASRITT